MWFLFGMGCVIVLWHSLCLPYDYFIIQTGDAIRKTGRMFDVTESTLRRRLSNPGTLTKNVGHLTVFSKSEEAQLAGNYKKPDKDMDSVGGRCCKWQETF